jgi:hypothetical protein
MMDSLYESLHKSCIQVVRYKTVEKVCVNYLLKCGVTVCLILQFPFYVFNVKTVK